jgi:hypothetical protein
MADLVFWLWAPLLLILVAVFGLALTRRDKMHPGE